MFKSLRRMQSFVTSTNIIRLGRQKYQQQITPLSQRKNNQWGEHNVWRACSSQSKSSSNGFPPLSTHLQNSKTNFENSPIHTSSVDDNFEIVKEETLFHRYQTVYQRDVRYPDGKIVSYDVLGTPHTDFKSVFVFPYNTKTKTVTMLKEYAPGQNTVHAAFVAGMYEPNKHESLYDAVQQELSEEAQLTGGKIIPLVDDHEDKPLPTSADKYSRNEFFYFLALDCVADLKPGERDEEEWIEVVRDLDVNFVKRLVHSGQLNTPHALLAMLALDKIFRNQLH